MDVKSDNKLIQERQHKLWYPDPEFNDEKLRKKSKFTPMARVVVFKDTLLAEKLTRIIFLTFRTRQCLEKQ